jgi:hypothetical protein
MIVNLICHTENCENADIAIPFEDPADTCICGPCGQEITDKVALDG